MYSNANQHDVESTDVFMAFASCRQRLVEVQIVKIRSGVVFALEF